MISTEIYEPKSPLAEVVVCFYVNKGNELEYSGTANPTINQELFFNLGDRFELQYPGGPLISGRNWISGIQSKPATVNVSGRHLTAGVIFKPWGLYAGFGIDAKSLHNRSLDSRILCNLGPELKEVDISGVQIFDLMEKALLKAFKKGRVTLTMERIVNDMDREELAVISEKIGRSRKSIIDSFNRIVGLSPQKYYTLKRVCDTIAVLQHNPTIRLTQLAYDHGFYDQAHFIRVFKAHTGLTPTQFRAKTVQT